MKRIGFLVGVFAALACAAVTSARIDEIAAWLPEKPAADGACIKDRAKWDALAALPEAKARISVAEKFLVEAVPDTPDALYLEFSQNGNRSHYQECLGRRMQGLDRLYLAECLENRGRFIPKIVEYLDAFCAMKSWTLPAHDGPLTCFKGSPHVDLMCGHIALQLAYCCAWLDDRLPAATQRKVRAEIDRRAFQPHLDHARGVRKVYCHWWFHGENNWNSVCNACIVRSALALVEDRRLRAEFVAIAEETVPYALRGYTADGYCSEGMGYWNYGYGHHLQMGLSVRAATGGKLDFFADPKCREIMKYAYGFQVQDGRSPHFADGGGNAGASNLALGRQIWPDLANDAALNCSLFAGDVHYFSLRGFGQEPARTEPTMNVLPLRSWFPDAQVLISRVHHPDLTMHLGIAFKGGHNAELHNHNDIGSYYIMLDGTEMGGDPDGETYTRRTFSKDRYLSKMLNSYGHPVPVVGGALQQSGRHAEGKVLRTVFTDTRDEIAIEYASAYPVKTLKSLVRTMTFDRVADRITITDKIICSAPTSFEVPVITYRTWKQNADATTFFFDKTAKTYRKLKMEVKASAPVAFRKDVIENPGHPNVQRLGFAFTQPVTEATFTTIYTSR